MGQFWEVGTDGSVKGYGIHENLLLNGGFEIDQTNNGSVYTNPANGAFTLDSWQVLKAGSSLPTVNVNRAARTDLGAQVDSGNYAMKLVVSGAGSPDVQYAIYQVFSNYQQFKGLKLSLSVRVYSSLPNAVKISIDDGITETVSAFHPGGGAYQTLTVTQTIATTATYLHVNVFRAFAPDLQIGTFFVDSAMLVSSSFPVTFRQRGTDYGLDGSRLVAGSVNQDRINTASFVGSGIGFNQTGTIQVFYQATPPSGWTQLVTNNDKALRIVSGAGGGVGGSSSMSTGFNLAHAHTVNSHSHTVNAHTHGITGHSHTVNSHSHTVNSHTHGVSSDGTHAHTVNGHTHSIGADGTHNHTGASGGTAPGTDTFADHQHKESFVFGNTGGTEAFQISDTAYDHRPERGPWGVAASPDPRSFIADPCTGHTFSAYTAQSLTSPTYSWALTSPEGSHSHVVNSHTHSIGNDGSHSHAGATGSAGPGTDSQGAHAHGAATGATAPGTDAQAPGTSATALTTDAQSPGTSAASPGTDTILGTFTLQYIDVIVAQKN